MVAGVHVASVSVIPLPAPPPHHVGVRRNLGTDALPKDAMVEGPDGRLLLLVNESEGSCLAKQFEAPECTPDPNISSTCSRKCVSRVSHISFGSSVASTREASMFFAETCHNSKDTSASAANVERCGICRRAGMDVSARVSVPVS